MKRSLSLADDLLLWGALAVVVMVVFGVLGAIVSTVFFAIKVFIVILAVGLGIKAVSAIGGGSKRRELNR